MRRPPPSRRLLSVAWTALTVDDAFAMHRVADFYEVLGLRDACCRFLLESLRPHNCCQLLSGCSS